MDQGSTMFYLTMARTGTDSACPSEDVPRLTSASTLTSTSAPMLIPAAPTATKPHVVAANECMLSFNLNKQQPRPIQVYYRECLKNHAVSIGGHALDGCREFFPSGKDGTIEALVCAACSCHCNFHRREVEGEVPHPCSCNSLLSHPLPSMRSLIPFCSCAHPHLTLPLSLPLRAHADRKHCPQNSTSRKKRFRTKFTPQQKEAMVYFAERMGWKVLKQDEDMVQRFCDDVGVNLNVLKVWMHNNKNNLAKKLNKNAELAVKHERSPGHQ